MRRRVGSDRRGRIDAGAAGIGVGAGENDGGVAEGQGTARSGDGAGEASRRLTILSKSNSGRILAHSALTEE